MSYVFFSPLSDSQVVYRNRDGDVIKFDFDLNDTHVLLSNSIFVSVFTLSLFKHIKYSNTRPCA